MKSRCLSSSSPRGPSAALPLAHHEAVAQFRLAVIGPLVGREFARGELRQHLRQLAQQPWRPPGSRRSVRLGASTIERWYYAWLRGGLAALSPRRRTDSGRGRTLSEAQRTLLLDVRREFPQASSALILRTLVAEGRLAAGSISVATANRLYAEHGLQRVGRHAVSHDGAERRRWQSSAPGVLWHADVCHGPMLKTPQGSRVPVRIHALLDDASRFVLALEVRSDEREVQMLSMLARAVLSWGAPQVLYLDNGSTYRGDHLSGACARLKISLQHAAPYDPQARGKMERFWRTLREQCLDYLHPTSTLHDIQVRLNAWLDTHYHQAAHSGLMGRSPLRAWDRPERACVSLERSAVQDAFMAQERRRVRKDSTLQVGGETWELDARHLSGKTVLVRRSLLPALFDVPPTATFGDRSWVLHPVCPTANATRRRERPAPSTADPAAKTGFNPATTALDVATRRLPRSPKRNR